MNDTETIDRLAELGEEIDRHFAGVDLAPRVLLDLEASDAATARAPARWSDRSRRRLLLVAAVLVLVVAVTAALPGPRRTVARWFGIGAVEIRTVPEAQDSSGTGSSSSPTPTSAPSPTAGSAPATTGPSDLDLDALGPAVTGDRAMATTGLPLPVATTLGEPASWRLPGGRQVVAVYPRDGHVVLVGVLGGVADTAGFSKQVSAGQASALTVDGAPGVWITGGQHLFAVIDESGVVAVDPVRVAAETLLWERDGLTYRVEGARALDEALAVAQSVELRTEP